MQPIRVDKSEFRERFETLTGAAQVEPVVITENGTDELVVLSSKEWDRLRRRDRRVGLTGELPGEWREAVEAAEVPVEFAHLDNELD